MLTGQNYDSAESGATHNEPTAQNSPQTVNSGHNLPTTPDERRPPADEEWHRQQVDKATTALVVTVNSFFDLYPYEELTPVRVMGNVLKHWLTTEYKDQIRQLTNQDLETTHLDHHLSAMLDTMGFLSLLERDQRMLELFRSRV